MRTPLGLFFAVVLLVAASVPGRAAVQHDERLDGLFVLLEAAPNADTAHVIERDIWTLWTTSGDDEIDGLMAVGIAAMALGKYDTALNSFDAIVDTVPGFAEGWNKRATLHYLMGDYPASIQDIERTLALEPRHFGALSGLGLILTATGDDEAAIRAFEKALAIHPFLPGAKANVETLRAKVDGRAI